MFTKYLSPFVLNNVRYFLRSRIYSTQNAVSPNDGIVLSDTCVKRLKELCNDNVFLRLCVESGGCSGFQYKFTLDEQMSNDDKYEYL